MSSIAPYINSYLVAEQCSPWSYGVDKLCDQFNSAPPLVERNRRIHKIAKRVSYLALYSLKAAALVVGVIALSSLLGIMECVVHVCTMGKMSLVRPLVALILTPSSFAKPTGWDPLMLKATSFLLVDQSQPSRPTLQAYRIPSLKFKEGQSSRLVVLCNPNGVGSENFNWLKMNMEDNLKQYPHENVEFLSFDYRGTGRSEGNMWNLNEALDDAQLAASWADKWSASRGLDMSAVTFSGCSLGGGAAAVMGARYPQAQLRLSHTFRSWSAAAEGVAANLVGADLAWIVRPLARLLGGDAYAPQKALLEREIRAKHLKVNPGRVVVETALNDRAITRKAALFIPKSCCEGEFAAQYAMRARFVGHMQIN